MPLPAQKPHLRRVLRFSVLALAFYILLMMPWPGVERAYAHLFRIGSELLFGSAVKACGGKVAFERIGNPPDSNDTLVRIGNYRTGRAQKARMSSRYMGYTSAALVAALVLATPMTRARKLKALAWGLLLVHAFIALRVGLKLIHLGRTESVALFTFGPWSGRVFSIIHHLLVTIPETKFLVAPVVWILVSFRSEDLASFRKSVKGKTPPQGIDD